MRCLAANHQCRCSITNISGYSSSLIKCLSRHRIGHGDKPLRGLRRKLRFVRGSDEFLDEVKRAVLSLAVNAADVLAEDSQQEHLYAAEKEQPAGEQRISAERGLVEQ